MQKIIIGNGKLSKIIAQPDDLVLDHSLIDIDTYRGTAKGLNSRLFDLDKEFVIINTAAKINLEWCEDNKFEAYDTNTRGPINILELIQFMKTYRGIKIKFVHISSGCIFDGNHFMADESTPPSPAAWYTRTKTWADEAIANYGYDDYLILRPRQLISKAVNSTNMITKFLSLAKGQTLELINEPNSITCMEDLKLMIEFLIEKDATGIYNCTNTGSVTPLDIGNALATRFDYVKTKEISYESFLSKVQVRRVNTLLSTDKLEKLGYQNRSGLAALEDVVKGYDK